MNEISIFLVHMMDDISVNTPCDVPEKVLLLFEIAFDCIRRLYCIQTWTLWVFTFKS